MGKEALSQGHPSPSATPVLQLERLSKSFGGVTVLHDVGLQLRPGEIRGLLGQNGSGKSTLIKILSGFHTPDPGWHVAVNGRDARLPMTPHETRRHGLAFVHQDLALADDAPVVDNVRIKMFGPRPTSRIRWGRERDHVRRSLSKLGLEVDPATPVKDLTEAARTIVAVCRAIEEVGDRDRGVLVVDEATASLPANAVSSVLAALRSLAARGFGILYVSHRLDEVLDLADTVTVLRDGRVVLDRAVSGITRQALVEAIVGSSYLEYEREERSDPTDGARGILSAERLAGDVVLDLNLTHVRAGEVVGITGLVGSGFEEVPALLFGAIRARTGMISWKGRRVDAVTMRPDKARALGFAYLPATRLGQAALGNALVHENVSLPWLGRFFERGWLRTAQERDIVSELLRNYDVRPANPDANFSSLSGGNQQKALLGRELMTEPGLLLLAEPTHGIDVAAKSDVLRRIRAFADAGGVAVIGSSEPEELAKICDRVVVLKDGRVRRVLQATDIDARHILEACYA